MKKAHLLKCLSGALVLTAAVAASCVSVAAERTSGIIYETPDGWTPDTYGTRNSAVSPRAIQLQYQDNEEDNGKMLVTWEFGVIENADNGKVFPIYESLDAGETWESVGNVIETQNQTPENADNRWGMECCPELYELPGDVGDMKKGGIVCIGCVCPKDLSKTHFDMYYSEDLGRTWEFKSSLVTDGGRNYMGDDPVWEPFILYDEPTSSLICYYSDERYSQWNQKLVYQSTTDGLTWDEAVDVVAWTDPGMRPGMPIVTQLENGYYVMVYEAVGLNNNNPIPCNYKLSLYPNDPFHWDAEDVGITYGYGGSPYCLKLDNGYVAMTASKESGVFINTKKDLTGEWIVYDTGVPTGYNRQLIQLKDGELYILSCGFPDKGYQNTVSWGKMDVNSRLIPEDAVNIINQYTGRYMCVWSSSKDDNARVVGWTNSGSLDLNWTLEKVSADNQEYYKIINVNSGKVLTPSSDNSLVQMPYDEQNKAQFWSIQETENGNKIINVSTGLLLSSNERKENSGTASQVALYLEEDKGTETQLWNIGSAVGDAVSYNIINGIDNETAALYPNGGSVKAGADQYFIIQAKQGYKISGVQVNGNPVKVTGTWFKVSNVNSDLNITADYEAVREDARFVTNKESGKMLCLPKSSTKEGEKILEWTRELNNNFYWILEPVTGNGAYQIKNLNSNKVLSVEDASMEAGAAVVQTGNDSDADLWLVTEMENGYFSIINSNSGLALTRGEADKIGDRYAVQQPYTGADSQLWNLEFVRSRQLYTIQTEAAGNGTVTANRIQAGEGETVYLTVTPDEGYELTEAGLTVNGTAIQGTSFVMPAEDVNVQAVFNETVQEAVLESVEIKTLPDKLSYLVNEDMNLTGIVLSATFSDGSTKEITDIELMQVKGFDSAAPGNILITVTYTENGVSKSVDFQISVQIPADMTALNLAIAMGTELEKEQVINHSFTDESYAAVETALAAARAVAENSMSAQKDADQALLDLIEAYANLENGTVNFGLQAAISGTMVIMEDPATAAIYSEESIQNVETALKAAQETAENPDASQEEINSSTRMLITAVNNLLKKEDSRLHRLLLVADRILESAEKYTSTSIAVLQGAVDMAKEAAGNPDASEDELNQAYNSLAEALANIQMRGNKDELQDSVNKACEILANKDRYVTASLEGLEAVNTEAAAVLTDKDAIQEEINAVLARLIQEMLDVRLLGDVNNDKTVDTKDASILLKFTAEMTELSSDSLDAADVNRDQVQDTKDVTQILKMAAEEITSF